MNGNNSPDDIESASSEKALHTELQRLGDVNKCPACGSNVDADAYHCPTCRNYFCFRCRARHSPREIQLQCINQDCNYYGKLVCDICNPIEEKEESPSIYVEPEDGYWPAWLLLALVVSLLVWYWSTFFVALASGVLLFVLAGCLLHLLGLNIFGKKREVELTRKSILHPCIACSEPSRVIENSGNPNPNRQGWCDG